MTSTPNWFDFFHIIVTGRCILKLAINFIGFYFNYRKSLDILLCRTYYNVLSFINFFLSIRTKNTPVLSVKMIETDLKSSILTAIYTSIKLNGFLCIYMLYWHILS